MSGVPSSAPTASLDVPPAPVASPVSVDAPPAAVSTGIKDKYAVTNDYDVHY